MSIHALDALAGEMAGQMENQENAVGTEDQPL